MKRTVRGRLTSSDGGDQDSVKAGHAYQKRNAIPHLEPSLLHEQSAVILNEGRQQEIAVFTNKFPCRRSQESTPVCCLQVCDYLVAKSMQYCTVEQICKTVKYEKWLAGCFCVYNIVLMCAFDLKHIKFQ